MSNDRREFLRTLGAAVLAAPLASCFRALDPEAVREASQQSGPTTYGAAQLPTHFQGYRDLLRLPYFEDDGSGRLRCVVDDARGTIDFHTHLGMSYLLAGRLDLQRRTDATDYLFDCSGVDTPCLLNFNLYQNKLAGQQILDHLRRELIRSGLPGGSPSAGTHTIPNLLADMDALGIERSVVLPVALDLPFGANPTAEWFAAARASAAPERLVMFGSVHPGHDDALRLLHDYKLLGVAGIKIHPPMQRIYPDSDEAMAVIDECGRLGLPVLFHAGRAGIEPESSQAFAVMQRYRAPIEEFPNVRFVLGHAGCRLDADEARALARRHPNVWLEISGQGLPQLEAMLREVDPGRLLYGTDWPFYPQAPALAKVLMVTEGDRTRRRMILRENALAFLAGA